MEFLRRQQEQRQDNSYRKAKLSKLLGSRKPPQTDHEVQQRKEDIVLEDAAEEPSLEVQQQELDNQETDAPPISQPEMAIEEIRENTATVFVDEDVSEHDHVDSILDDELGVSEEVFLWSERAVYHEVTPLGEGRQCRVYRLVEKSTGRRRLLFEAQEGKVQSLVRHAKILEGLKGHPHFFQFESFEEESDSHPAYMLCEDPGTVCMEEYLSDSISPDDRMAVIRQLVNAFRILHEKAGKLHTDPFPKQLYVRKNDQNTLEVFLSDLGDAESVHSQLPECQNSLLQETESETALFNTSFASGDKRRGTDYDQQSEIEVVSRIATWILTGNEPIDGVRTTLEEFRESLDEVSPELDDMILRLTVAADRNREKRYKNMTEFWESLESSTKEKLNAGKSLGVRVDFDHLDDPATVAHLRKALGSVDPADLDPRIVKAFEALESREEKMLVRLKNICRSRDELEKEDYYFVRNCLQFPSEGIQGLATYVAYKRELASSDQKILGQCIDLIYEHRNSNNPECWQAARELHVHHHHSEYGTLQSDQIEPKHEVHIALNLLTVCFEDRTTVYREFAVMSLISNCLLKYHSFLNDEDYLKISKAALPYIRTYGKKFAEKYADIRHSLKCQWNSKYGHRIFSFDIEYKDFKRKLDSNVRTELSEGYSFRQYTLLLERTVLLLAGLLEDDENNKSTAQRILLSIAASINDLDHAQWGVKVVQFHPELTKKISALLFRQLVLQELAEGKEETYFDRLANDCSLYESISLQMIAKALDEGSIPETWALAFLEKYETEAQRPLGRDTLHHIMPPCGQFDPSVHQRRLDFALSREMSNSVKISRKYHELLRTRLKQAIADQDNEKKINLLEELKGILPYREYIELCFDEGCVDEAFQSLEKTPFREISDTNYLVQKIAELAGEDQEISRSSSLAMRKINRGEKLDIKGTRYDQILGQAMEHIWENFDYLFRKFYNRRNFGIVFCVDYTDVAYETLDTIFSLLAIISKSANKEEQGRFEKSAMGLLERFRRDHPAVFDTEEVGGVLSMLQLRKYSNHRRMGNNVSWKGVQRNPDEAIEIRNKYAGL